MKLGYGAYTNYANISLDLNVEIELTEVQVGLFLAPKHCSMRFISRAAFKQINGVKRNTLIAS